MYKRVGSWLAILVLIVFLASLVSAVRVGVVVEFPEGEVFKKCLSVDEDTNGYDLMGKTGLDITWSAPGPWGHGLCAIEGVGCPSSNCFFCDASAGGTIYWNFYIKESGENSWSYSPVGSDGGSSCSEHYCAKEGDVLGFAYGGFGTEPPDISFGEVCPTSRIRERRSKKFDVSISPDELFVGESISIVIEDSSTDKGIKDAEVDVFKGNIGTSEKIFSGETDSKGKISFKLDNSGIYNLRLNVRGYNPPQKSLEIDVKPKLPETTTSTTSTSTTTIETTTSTTTTTTTSTTTTTDPCAKITCPPYCDGDIRLYDGECRDGTCVYGSDEPCTYGCSNGQCNPPATTTTIPETPGIIARVVAFSAENSFLIFALIILIFVAYFGYNFYKKKR